MAGMHEALRALPMPWGRAIRWGARCLAAALLAAALIAGGAAAAAKEDAASAASLAAAHPAAVRPQTAMFHRSAGPDTLMDIARRYGLGFVELQAANPGVDPWFAGEERAIVVPRLHLEPWSDFRDGERSAIVVNLGDMRLYFYPGGGQPAISLPIGIGREGWATPTGKTSVVLKRENPTWIPPASIRAGNPGLPARVPPGPTNPLGSHALNLGWQSYVIHGTNKPDGVGRRVSHGCLRLYPEDIARLFEKVEVGTPVVVVDQPVKLAWIGDALYLEVHPSAQQARDIDLKGSFEPEPLPDLRVKVAHFPGAAAVEIDWPAVERAARERRGVAVRISR